MYPSTNSNKLWGRKRIWFPELSNCNIQTAQFSTTKKLQGIQRNRKLWPTHRKTTETIPEEFHTLCLLDKDLISSVLNKSQQAWVQVLALSLIPYMSKKVTSILWVYVSSGFIKWGLGWPVVTSWELTFQFSLLICSVYSSQCFF